MLGDIWFGISLFSIPQYDFFAHFHLSHVRSQNMLVYILLVPVCVCDSFPTHDRLRKFARSKEVYLAASREVLIDLSSISKVILSIAPWKQRCTSMNHNASQGEWTVCVAFATGKQGPHGATSSNRWEPIRGCYCHWATWPQIGAAKCYPDWSMVILMFKNWKCVDSEVDSWGDLSCFLWSMMVTAGSLSYPTTGLQIVSVSKFCLYMCCTKKLAWVKPVIRHRVASTTRNSHCWLSHGLSLATPHSRQLEQYKGWELRISMLLAPSCGEFSILKWIARVDCSYLCSSQSYEFNLEVDLHLESTLGTTDDYRHSKDVDGSSGLKF